MLKVLLLVALFAGFSVSRVVYSERCGFGDVDFCTVADDDWVMVDRANPR
jgi:hypothetical protein